MKTPTILGAILTLSFSLPAHAAQRTAATCSRSDVVTAINAAVDGDTVNIPGGSCSWTSAITTPKALTIVGAGQGATNITGGGFDMTAPNGKNWRITAMTIKGNAGIGVYSQSKAWRIDHVTFDTVEGRPSNRIIWIEPCGPDYTKGVIDHNNFINPQSIQIHYRAQCDGGNGEFIRALGLGTDDAVYVEDNAFTHAVLEVSNPTTDCDGGGRLVFRYNTVQNSYFEMHDAIVGGLRSCRKWEVYNNTFRMTYNSGQFTFIGIRGGTGVIANNTFTTGSFYITSPIVVSLYRLAQPEGDPWDALCSSTSGRFTGASTTAPQGCTGTTNGCIAMDGLGPPSGYPCRDQFGFDGNNPQVSRPVLIYGNTLNGAVSNSFEFNGPGNPTTYIVNNREYCTGTTKPAFCNGVTTTYTPYTYPHPLTTGGGGGTPPAPPTNLVVR